MKIAFLRLCRVILRLSPKFLQDKFAKLPFSRFSKIANCLFCGQDIVRWNNCLVRINPERLHEFFLYFFGVYSGGEIKKLNQLCKDMKIFADIGANIGLFSLAVASTNPKIEVYSFEPSRQAVEDFCFNLKLNPEISQRVHVIPKATSEENSDLFFCPGTDIETGRIKQDMHSHAGYRVDTVRLDNFFSHLGRYPQVVKIDVEGSELAVLKGMKGLFQIGLPNCMLIELHPCYHALELDWKIKIKSILEEASYELFLYDTFSNKQKLLPAPEEWPDLLHVLAIRK